MAVKIINDSAANVIAKADIIVTDPPFDMRGKQLVSEIAGINADHLLLLTSMRQLLEFTKESSEWKFSFDIVLNQVTPKKSKSIRQPNYTHVNGVYMTRNKAKSAFDRKRFQRSDCFDGKGYWPTIINAPRSASSEHSHSKNVQALTDIVGAFDVGTIIDPFAGGGTTALAAFEHDIDCTLVERDENHYNNLVANLRFMGVT